MWLWLCDHAASDTMPPNDRATERPSERPNERATKRAIERTSDRATERPSGRARSKLQNNYLRKVHNSSSRASSDTMPEPSDVENCWVTLCTRVGASNHPNIVQKVTQSKNTDFFKMKFGPDQDHLGIIGVPPQPIFASDDLLLFFETRRQETERPRKDRKQI